MDFISFKCLPISSKHKVRGWKDGSEVKSTGCTSRRPGFGTQYPHDSQPSVSSGESRALFRPLIASDMPPQAPGMHMDTEYKRPIK